jgi:hypothetical protein
MIVIFNMNDHLKNAVSPVFTLCSDGDDSMVLIEGIKPNSTL